MDMDDFAANGGYAFVVGLAFSFPPRYASFTAASPSGWMWADELTDAETFRTKKQAEAHMIGDMAELVDGIGAKVLKVEMKVGPA